LSSAAAENVHLDAKISIPSAAAGLLACVATIDPLQLINSHQTAVHELND
jgi:hypothetical protein